MEHEPFYNQPKVGEKIAQILFEQSPVAEIINEEKNHG